MLQQMSYCRSRMEVPTMLSRYLHKLQKLEVAKVPRFPVRHQLVQHTQAVQHLHSQPA